MRTGRENARQVGDDRLDRLGAHGGAGGRRLEELSLTRHLEVRHSLPDEKAGDGWSRRLTLACQQEDGRARGHVDRRWQLEGLQPRSRIGRQAAAGNLGPSVGGSAAIDAPQRKPLQHVLLAHEGATLRAGIPQDEGLEAAQLGGDAGGQRRPHPQTDDGDMLLARLAGEGNSRLDARQP